MTFLHSRRIPVGMLALALGIVVGGCSGGDESPVATNQTLFPSTSTTIGVDEIPEEITVEYVQRVVDAIDAAAGDTFRLLKRENEMNDEVRARLDALYVGDLLATQEQAFQFRIDSGFEGIREDPGNMVSSVEEFIHGSTECIFFRGSSDTSAHFSDISEPDPPMYMGLAARPERVGPSPYNPTSWVVFYDALFPEGRPENPCDS